MGKKLTIEKMRKIAKTRGGKCLSKKYVNPHTPLEWECARGHRWKATPNNVKNKRSWCPECEVGIGERICRAYLRQIFGKPFPKSRPRWLKNSRGNQMELDGYCKTLKIAFEHQGEQHFTTDSLFINSKVKLQRRKKDDKEKRHLCKENGVRLIFIPELFSRTELEDLQRLIYNECKRLRIRRPAGMLDKSIKITSAWKSNRTERILKEIQSIATSRGGKCLSKKYFNTRTKLQLVCEKGHRWESTTGNIRKGKWCSECAGLKKLTIEQMQAIAKSRGGKCLSKKYVDGKTKLLWECSDGHRWNAQPRHIKNTGSWCPECALGKKYTIGEMKSIAKSLGGKCLSKKCVNGRDRLQWECKEGHRWESTASNVRMGKWCAKCAGVKKLTIEEMQEVAKSRGGRCISKRYVDANSKLEWECERGHRWKTTPNNVKNKRSWCLQCAGKELLTIEQMQTIAKERGGKCLSKKYVNSKTKLQWECAEGHRWKAVQYSVRSLGTWCPKCQGK